MQLSGNLLAYSISPKLQNNVRNYSNSEYKTEFAGLCPSKRLTQISHYQAEILQVILEISDIFSQTLYLYQRC